MVLVFCVSIFRPHIGCQQGLREPQICYNRCLVELDPLRADRLRCPDEGEHPQTLVLERIDDLAAIEVELF